MSFNKENDIKNIWLKQKDFFQQGHTLTYAYRREQLEKLEMVILKYEKEIKQALFLDLGKSELESYVTEIGFVLASINFAKKNLKKWMKIKTRRTPLYLFYAKSTIELNPYGNVLIIGPYNYPFQLLIEPLIGAIAAGNCIVLSASDIAYNTAQLVKKMIEETFIEEYIYCFIGGKEINDYLLKYKFDYIFFTGSENVGKYIMKKAAEKLIPVTLELGGKSPVIIDKTAKLDIATTRIAWGKFLNAGQTCVAPDHIFVDKNISEEFIIELKKTIKNFYGEDIENNNDYGRIINRYHFNRLKNILNENKKYIIAGGKINEDTLFIGPTLIFTDKWNITAMNEEIFGPILPILLYERIEDVIEYLRNREKPLAVYVFSEDKQFIDFVVKNTVSGGVAINDTINQLANPNLPFGGIGNSGMGRYHGKYSFMTFSWQRSILQRTTKLNLNIVFPPFTNLKDKLIRKFLR